MVSYRFGFFLFLCSPASQSLSCPVSPMSFVVCCLLPSFPTGPVHLLCGSTPRPSVAAPPAPAPEVPSAGGTAEVRGMGEWRVCMSAWGLEARVGVCRWDLSACCCLTEVWMPLLCWGMVLSGGCPSARDLLALPVLQLRALWGRLRLATGPRQDPELLCDALPGLPRGRQGYLAL